jgi:very-short-patch-repair endonuclease
MTTVSPNALDRLLSDPNSHVRLVFASIVDEVQDALEHMAISSGGQFRLVTVSYDPLPTVRSLIDDVLDNLARVALALFPHWYGNGIPFAEIDAATPSFDSLLANQAKYHGLLARGVSIPWLKAARKLCRLEKPPLPREFTASVHVAQLALAIDLSPVLIALILRDESPVAEGLQGLARMSEWLARESGSRVMVVVPELLSSSTELDSINFEAIRLSTRQVPLVASTGHVPLEHPQRSRSQVSVFPVIGRPHPFSRGEQLLAKRLAQDEMLGGLFRFNIPVTTRSENRYLADLVWTEGKIIVEVDGYEFHSDRAAFSLDRHRDYELMISGYLVVRLPHDEIVDDVELAVEKIRDVVRFRQTSNLPRNENSQ